MAVDTQVRVDAPAGLPVEVSALIEVVDALVERAGSLEGWSATEAVVAVEQQIARLTGVAARLLARVEADGLWATGSERSLAGWLAARIGSRYQDGKSRVELARALRDHLPLTARALTDGGVSVDQAAALASLTTTTPVRREALAGDAEACGEAFLLEQAKVLSAAELRNLARNWAAAVDPEADERGYREASEAEFVALSQTTGGFHLAGFLTTDHGATLQEALAAVTPVPAPDDTRTAQQRRAGALTDLARIVLDQGLAGTGSVLRPHLNVVVDYDTLVRTMTTTDLLGAGGHGPGTTAGFSLRPVMDIERFAVAEIIGAGPIPPSVLARLACDSSVSRIVFGPESQVVDAGRSERYLLRAAAPGHHRPRQALHPSGVLRTTGDRRDPSHRPLGSRRRLPHRPRRPPVLLPPRARPRPRHRDRAHRDRRPALHPERHPDPGVGGPPGSPMHPTPTLRPVRPSCFMRRTTSDPPARPRDTGRGTPVARHWSRAAGRTTHDARRSGAHEGAR